MSEAGDRDQLEELDDKINALKESMEPAPRADEHYSLANMAWRMVLELVVGLAIGFGIGFGLDWLFGTSPFLMVLFLLLGFVAGIKTMLRTASEIQANQVAKAAKDERD